MSTCWRLFIYHIKLRGQCRMIRGIDFEKSLVRFSARDMSYKYSAFASLASPYNTRLSFELIKRTVIAYWCNNGGFSRQWNLCSAVREGNARCCEKPRCTTIMLCPSDTPISYLSRILCSANDRKYTLSDSPVELLLASTISESSELLKDAFQIGREFA